MVPTAFFFLILCRETRKVRLFCLQNHPQDRATEHKQH